jgi:hypothetical protein
MKDCLPQFLQVIRNPLSYTTMYIFQVITPILIQSDQLDLSSQVVDIGLVLHQRVYESENQGSDSVSFLFLDLDELYLKYGIQLIFIWF